MTGDAQGQTPEATQQPDTAGTQATAEQTPEAQPEKPAVTESPLELIPQDPETSDEVLLQDIYALMDLEQFALNPNEPIPLPEEGVRRFIRTHLSAQPGKNYPPSYFDYDEIRHHPYLHLFPTLRAHVQALEQLETEKPHVGTVRNREIPYTPYRDPRRTIDHNGRWESPTDGFHAWEGTAYFIHHPWFERVRLSALQHHNALGSNYDDAFNYPEGQPALPHWFGKNSTRGVLADAVREALEQAQKPDAQRTSLPVDVEPARYTVNKPYTVDMDLGSYLRSPISIRGSDAGDVDKNPDAHRTPFVQWEFVHSRLPIIRVTTFVITLLPLAGPDGEPATATFSTSFVVSFQNRWTSFEDHGRQLVRYEDDMTAHPRLWRWGINPEFHQQHFPNYWHPSDYMQHRLIGPVVVTVHENLNGDPGALIPGTYAVEPRISHWEAPGPVLPDRQIPLNGHTGSTPSPNWPLPGHVLTTPGTGPGSGPWEDLEMDRYDW